MSKRKQGHWCWVCRCYRANEKFTGKGHAKHICKDCAQKQKRLKKFRQGEQVLIVHKKRRFEASVHNLLMDKGKVVLKVILFGKETDVEVDSLKVQKSEKEKI